MKSLVNFVILNRAGEWPAPADFDHKHARADEYGKAEADRLLRMWETGQDKANPEQYKPQSFNAWLQGNEKPSA